jgi:Winged helix DNA-binding domain
VGVLLRARLTAQLLAGALAVQAQDLRGARLAIRARTRGLSAADVDRAFTEERSLVVSWLNRGTLHLVRREDYRWLHALTTPPLFTANARRLAQEGVSPRAAGRGVAVIERSLADDGPLTREELRERLRRAGVPTEGQALVHVLMLAALRGIAVRAPMRGRRHAYALARDWLGEPKPVDRDTALAELARRYLAGHGPASDRDLAKWAGLPLRDARAALSAISSDLDQGAGGLVDVSRRSPPARLPPPRLLGAYEPVLLGWTSREPVLGAHDAAVVGGGLFRPFAMVRGRAAGTWKIDRGEVAIAPFDAIGDDDAAALDADARDVLRFLAAE